MVLKLAALFSVSNDFFFHGKEKLLLKNYLWMKEALRKMYRGARQEFLPVQVPYQQALPYTPNNFPVYVQHPSQNQGRYAQRTYPQSHVYHHQMGNRGNQWSHAYNRNQTTSFASQDLEDPAILYFKKRKRPYDSPDRRQGGGKKVRSQGPVPQTCIPTMPEGCDSNSVDNLRNQKITEEIWRYYITNRQTEQEYQNKLNLRNALYAIFKDVFPYAGLYIVGSSMTGFSTHTSDMDICLMLSPHTLDKKEVIDLLVIIQNALRSCKFLKQSLIIRARCPILKFYDASSSTECDLNINNSVGIRNTHLLKYYSDLDWRVRPLVLMVKRWARFHDINDASKSTISSYTLCLMVIHYLQYACKPPVLCIIQKMRPDLFDINYDVRGLKMNAEINFESQNKDSLGTLFLGFLKYYAIDFDFKKDVASIRLGSRIPFHMLKQEGNMARDWNCLKVEEPFDHSNTARSCYDQTVFDRVDRVIRRSYNVLARKRDMQNILSQPF